MKYTKAQPQIFTLDSNNLNIKKMKITLVNRLMPSKSSRIFLLFIIAIGLSLFQATPFWRLVPGTDSGDYYYLGRTLLDGGRPYVDAWDNKPPLVYLIDMFGLMTTGAQGGTSWGVWFLEWLGLAISFFPLLVLCRRFWGEVGSSVFSIYVILSIPFFIQGGNQPDEWAVIATNIIFTLLFWPMPSLNSYLLIGFLSAWSCLCKPNCIIGLFTALLVIIICAERKKKLPYFYCLSVGFFLPILACLLWLNHLNALNAMFDAVIRYNHIFVSEVTPNDLFQTFQSIIYQLLKSGIGILGLISLFFWLQIFKKPMISFQKKFIFILFITSIVQIVMATLWGMDAAHHLIGLIPLLGLLSSASIADSLDDFSIKNKKIFNPELILTAIIFILLSINTYKSIQILDPRKQTVLSANILFRDLLPTEKYFVVLGFDPEIYFGTNKKSPIRFFYSPPMLTKNYLTPREKTFLKESIFKTEPAIILDARSNMILSDIERKCFSDDWYYLWVDDLIKKDYWLISYVKPLGWPVYARIKRNGY